MVYIARLIRGIEAKNGGVDSFFVTLLAIITARNFLENILEDRHAITLQAPFYHLVSDFCHVTFSWGSIFFTIVLLLALFSRQGVVAVARVALFFYPIIILVPLLDFFAFGSGAITYQYNFDSLFFSFVHLFDPRVSISYVTGGVRVELFVAVICSFIYLYSTTALIWRSVLGALAIYSCVYIYGYLPAIYNQLFSTSVNNIINHSILFSRSALQLNFLYYIPIVLLLATGLFMLLEQKIRRGLLVSLRIERLAIYLSLLCFGVVVAAGRGLVLDDLLNLYDLLKLLAAVLSLSCAFVFSTMLNDISDHAIDHISNSERPLVCGDIAPQDFAAIKTVFFVLSLCFALPVNEYFVFILIFILALSWLYSAEPFRLKRLFVVSHLLLASIGVAVFLLGSCLVDGILAFSSADTTLLAVIFSFFFTASHLKDIKDFTGDRACGVITLTTMVGAESAYRIVALLVSLALLAGGYLLGVNIVAVLSSLLIFGGSALVLKNSEQLLLVLQCCVAIIFTAYGFILL